MRIGHRARGTDGRLERLDRGGWCRQRGTSRRGRRFVDSARLAAVGGTRRFGGSIRLQLRFNTLARRGLRELVVHHGIPVLGGESAFCAPTKTHLLDAVVHVDRDHRDHAQNDEPDEQLAHGPVSSLAV